MNAPVAVFCGHMFSEGSDEETALAGRVGDVLDRHGICIAYGPLACGADIVIAEQVLARGGELNVVLPFAEDDFIAESVACGGRGWVARYHACRDAAARITFATPGAYVGDDHQFAYNTRLAMGLAVLRADAMGVPAIQLAIVSDQIHSLSRTGLAGAHADIRMWAALSRQTEVIAAGPVPRKLKFPPRAPRRQRHEARNPLDHLRRLQGLFAAWRTRAGVVHGRSHGADRRGAR